jgi:formylglycine-generating enzyme required for sulfatase activity
MYWVNWDEAQEFIRRLNALKDGFIYRLPTEAEWEYAARAGTTGPFAFGGSLTSSQANFDGNYPYGGTAKGPYLESTSPVGNYQPNAWGIYDMHGNLMEWCQDWYSDGYYGSSTGADPKGPSTGTSRVLRGGSWYSNAVGVRSALRDTNSPVGRHDFIGFRVVAAARTP